MGNRHGAKVMGFNLDVKHPSKKTKGYVIDLEPGPCKPNLLDLS